MLLKSKISEEEFKLINDKLDTLLYKIDFSNKILEGLINIELGTPPDITPETSINENKSKIPCNADTSHSTLKTPINENESNIQYNADTSDVSPNSIRFCLYKYTYIWERSGRNYWVFLLNVDRRTASGFRWFRNTWVYWGIDLRRIDSFICYR